MTPRLLVVFVVAAAVVLPGPARAQLVQVPAADVLAARVSAAAGAPAPGLGLADAVQLTMLHSPEVRQFALLVGQASGRQQEARGPFDPQVRASLSGRAIRQGLPVSLWSFQEIPAGGLPVPLDGRIDLRERGLAFEVGLSRTFRNGMAASGSVLVDGQQLRYLALDAGTGHGLDISPQYRSSTTFALTVPLRQGSGRVSVEAPERAAGLLLTAQRERLRHGVATQVLRTTLAYISLVAAGERVRLLEASADRQRRLVDLVGQQAEVGDLARFETNRASARAARVAGSLSASRAALVSAQVALALAAGLTIPDPARAPVAADRFAAAPATVPAVETLFSRAAALRRDLKGLDAERAAAQTLERAAVADLRNRVDLSLQAGASNLYEPPLASDGAGSRFPRGLFRPLTAPWRPFVVASVSVRLPFANRSARGRAVQAEAKRTDAEIQTAELHRVIRNNLVQATTEFREAALALQQWQAAVENGDHVLAAALERFQSHDLTLIDMLLTEEEVTSDAIQLVDQREFLFSTLARLKFDAGELVGLAHEGTAGELFTFDAAAFVSR